MSSQKSQDVKFIIDNETLHKEVSDYVNDNCEDSNKIFFLKVSKDNSYFVYEVFYCLDIYCIFNESIHMLFEFNSHKMFVSFVDFSDFKIDTESIYRIFKEHFVEDIEYYDRNDDYPPPITGSVRGLKLTFNNKNLIKKEFLNY